MFVKLLFNMTTLSFIMPDSPTSVIAGIFFSGIAVYGLLHLIPILGLHVPQAHRVESPPSIERLAFPRCIITKTDQYMSISTSYRISYEFGWDLIRYQQIPMAQCSQDSPDTFWMMGPSSLFEVMRILSHCLLGIHWIIMKLLL